MTVEHRVSEVAESAWAKFAARIVTPLLLAVLTVLLGLLTSTVASVVAKQDRQQEDINAVKTDLASLNTKVDWALVQRINSLEDRVRILERKVNP
ncbi:MAG: hypothetical protein NVV68_06825 [Dokdonella sp.]|nr:hypothetical protein [Dokdonella sp.]